MKKILILSILFLLPLPFFFSCERTTQADVDCSTYDYSDCNTVEPIFGDIHVKLTINDENKKIPLIIYAGKLEDNDIVLIDTAYSNIYDTLLPVDDFYTVKAEYKKGEKTIFAVDGDNIKKSKTKTCDSTCWSIKSASINLKMK